MMVPFLEGALSLEETDHFLKHIKECSGCREDLEIYYTVRTAIDGMDQDRFKTYNLKQQFEHDMSQVARQVRAGLFIQWLHHIADVYKRQLPELAKGIITCKSKKFDVYYA